MKNGSSDISRVKINAALLLKVRGLPWTTTKKELRNFFSGINILDGLNGIHFIADDPNNVGVAYMRMASKHDYDRAKGFHRKNLDGRYVDGTQKKNNSKFSCLHLI